MLKENEIRELREASKKTRINTILQGYSLDCYMRTPYHDTV